MHVSYQRLLPNSLYTLVLLVIFSVDSLSIDMGRPPPYDENPEPSLTARRRPRHGDKEGASSYSDNYMTPKEKIMRLAEISLPWQTRILAWILLVGGIGTSAAFTTFYGISFGDAACKQWLSSLFVSFFLDLCLTQPIKVSLHLPRTQPMQNRTFSEMLNDIQPVTLDKAVLYL